MSSGINQQNRNPFPGLRPFQEDEEHLFFGRENQVHTMVDKLSATRFLAVVGSSGSGKSSLVNCGLRPALHQGLMAKAGTSWRMAQFRPGGDPLRAMARALSTDGVLFQKFDSATLALEDIVEASLRMSKLGLSRVYEDAHLAEGTNLLVVVDQFEELFRYRALDSVVAEGQQRSQQATAFVNLLLDPSTHPGLPIYVVLTMRSDFLGDCAEFAGLPEAINGGLYLVPRLTREERRAAIARPVGVGGAKISTVLLTRLVNDVGDNPDQLSILQHALNRTWANWENEGHGQGLLQLSHYEAIGTMAHALDKHAEKAHGELPDEGHKRICEKIFKSLTDKGTDPRGIRRPTKFGTLCELAEADPDSVRKVIDVFRKPSRSFLMPPVPETLEPDRVIDISHESLMRVWERLKGWTEQEVQSARLYRRLSETAVLNTAGTAGLWDDPDLQFALDWKAKEKPTKAWAELYGGGFDQAMNFLAQSQSRRDTEAREREESHLRELHQAQELAAERQKRIEEQTQAAKRLKTRHAALRIVAIMLLGVAVYAGRENWSARKAQRSAEQASHTAEGALRTAELKTSETENALKAVQRKDDELEGKNESLRMWSRLTRQERLASANTVAWLADELIQHGTPQQSLAWRKVSGGTLLELGRLQEAEVVLNDTLKQAPDDEGARTSRGYLFLLKKDPKNASIDFKYIRDNINPHSTLNYLNLSIAQAELGEHKAAQTSIDLAIKNILPTRFSGGEETEVSPDIQLASGRTKIFANAEVFEVALHYMRANLEAYVGGADFGKKLQAADRKAEELPLASRDEAYLTAINWAWLHRGVSPNDYGALASQAYMWQKAGYQEWGWCYYDRFQSEDKRLADPRYVNLAKWVASNKVRPVGLPPSFSCNKLSEREPDVLTLELEANEEQARKQFREAAKYLDLALGKEPNNIRLLLDRAQVLYQLGQSERNARDYEELSARLAQIQLNATKTQETNEETDLQKLENQNDKDLKTAKLKLRNKYDGKISELENQIKVHQEAAGYQRGLANQDFGKLRDDCNQILKVAPHSPKAYFYRALAEYQLSSTPTPPKRVFDDLKIAFQLDPTDLDTLDWLSFLDSKSDPKESLRYLDQYQRLNPSNAAMYRRRAEVEIEEKLYGKALHSIEIAIAMEGDNLKNYEIREQAQIGMHITELRAKRTLAFGYRRAAELLEKEGKTESANQAYEKSWEKLAEIAKNGPNEEIRCDGRLTTCTFAKTVRVNSERIFSGIQSLEPGSGNEREVHIDKGTEDGIVVGQQGEIWSLYAEDSDGHERHVMKLGVGEVLSVEPRSALVRITMEKPEGDAMVREHDCLRLRARTLPHPEGSRLWPLVSYNITINDLKGNLIVDYRTLYSEETPELDNKLMQTMLEDLHESGRKYGDQFEKQFFESKPIPSGIFEGKTVRQAMESATLEDLNKSLDHALKYPGDFLGNKWKTETVYLYWLMAGAP
jgi:energy-coupling factor transporter ATP-binding protein EcfA2